MIKCYTCQNHQQEGKKHTCILCKNKIVYGQLQEQFDETCNKYLITKMEKARQEYKKKKTPIKD